MKLKMITPEKVILDEEVDSVTLPGKAGELTVLSGHAMLVSEISRGAMYYIKTDGEGKEIRTEHRIGDGFFEVQNDEAVLLTSSVE